MQKTITLNNLYEDYRTGFLAKKDFEGIIFKKIREETCFLPGLNYDDTDDFVSWLYLRLRRAIDSYRDTGSSFEVYIRTLVRLAAKEFRYRQARSFTTESAAWITQIPDMHACDPTPEYNICNAVEEEKQKRLHARPSSRKRNNPRQLLILVLKCCNYVSDDFVKKVSPVLGIEPVELAEMIDSLREQRGKREQEINILQEKVNNQFCRCMYFEQNLQRMPKDAITTERMKERLERGRNRIAKLREKLARLRMDPSNQQIADILGISKGTVDAALHILKLHNACSTDKNRHMLN